MEEKMLILKMLQEGKITADEALKLLETIEKTGANTTQSNSKANDMKDEFTAKLNDMKIDEKLNKFSEKASKLAGTFGEKASKLAEQLGENINTEKISNNTEKFAEEFSKRIEGLGQDIAESAAKFADTFGGQLFNLFDYPYERYKYSSVYTYPANESKSVYVRTSNFNIRVNPADTEEIIIKIFANSDLPSLTIDEYFKTISEEKTYKFSSEFPGKTWGRIEMTIPKGMDILSFSTDNAKCDINGMEVRLLSCSTANGKVILTKCTAEELEILTDNEKIILEDVSARTTNARTSNSKIVIENSRLDNIDAKTSNAPIVMNALRKGDSLNSNYILSTCNGKIDVELDAAETFEYMVDAHTTMSSIDVNLKNLTYTMDKNGIGTQNTAQVKSENFDTASNKITIKANTSNAAIYIKNI